MTRPSGLVQGSLDLVLLKLLALQPMHGWGIGQQIKLLSQGELAVSDASVYEALHRLEQDGWISGSWQPTANNRRAKVYSLTSPGRKQLARETGEWHRLTSAIGRIVHLRTIEP